MFYDQVRGLAPEPFKRLTGVKPRTFGVMVKALRQAETGKKRPGRPSKLALEDQVLMLLMYLREQRSFFHIAQSYRLHESNVCRLIHRAEAILSKEAAFRLPGKKRLQEAETDFEVILLDATESPVERPKKNSAATTAARSEPTPSKPS